MISTLTSKAIAVASLLAAGTLVPQSEVPSVIDQASAAAIKTESAVVRPAGDLPRDLHHVIPDPVPVPVSWTEQPIVIDLK